MVLATCCTVYYSLPHAIQLLLVLHTIQFTSVAALLTVQYLLPHAMQLLFVVTCAIEFAICCRMLYSCYFLPHAVQLLCVAASYAATILWLHAV